MPSIVCVLFTNHRFLKNNIYISKIIIFFCAYGDKLNFFWYLKL